MASTDKQYWLTKLASIESWARGLAEECYKTRKELGDVHSPAPRKGFKNLSVHAIQKRTKGLIMKNPMQAVTKNFNNGQQSR